MSPPVVNDTPEDGSRISDPPPFRRHGFITFQERSLLYNPQLFERRLMRKNLLILISIAVLSFGLLGCPPKENSGNTTTAAGSGDILIGEYGSMTGGQAT